MSGGAFDYAYSRVVFFCDELSMRLERAGELLGNDYDDTESKFSPEVETELRVILADATRLARLMREVEWLYSGDHGEESFMRLIKAVREGK